MDTSKLNQHLLFVYGTLKRNLSYHSMMNGSEFIDEAMTIEKFRLTEQYEKNDQRWIPYLTKKPEMQIKGEVFKISDEKLHFLDKFEEVDLGIYQRELIDVKLKSSEESLKVWVYVGTQDGKHLIDKGVFEENVEKPEKHEFKAENIIKRVGSEEQL